MAQSEQNVHSNEQMIAPAAVGGRSLSQHSQFGFRVSTGLSLRCRCNRPQRSIGRCLRMLDAKADRKPVPDIDRTDDKAEFDDLFF